MRHSENCNAPSGANGKVRRKAKTAKYRVTLENGKTFHLHVKGRTQWALEQLRNAGESGCTPIKHPGPRWSAYVHVLRSGGVAIETVTEEHGGDYPGHHGRYILRCVVEPVASEGAA
jgi:hypothetical protein